MNLTFLQGNINSLDDYFNSGKFAQCCIALDRINNNINPSFFTPSSKNFDIEFLNKQFFPHIMNLFPQKNEKLAEASKNFIIRWLSIYASVSPINFIKTFYYIMPIAKKIQLLDNLMKTLDIAFSNLGKAEIQNDLQLILNIISSVTANYEADIVPIKAWEIISDYCQDSEIIRYLPKCQKNPKATAVLIKRNPVLFMDSIFQTGTFEFLLELFSIFKPGYEFNYSTILDRLSQELIDPVNSFQNYNIGCKFLSEIINYFDLPISEEISSKISKMIESISFTANSEYERIHPSTSFGILTVLLSATKKNFYSKDSLKKLHTTLAGKIQSSLSRSAYLDSMLYCIEKNDDLTQLHKVSSSFKPWVSPIEFSKEIDIVIKYIPKLVEIDKLFLTHFVWTCCHPLLRELAPAISTMKLLIKVDNEILFDKQAAIKADKIVYTYIKLNNDELNGLIAKFIRKCHVKLDMVKIDLFGENMGFLLPFIDNNLFREMIDYGMFMPSTFSHALNFMVRSQKEYTKYLNHVFGILELISLEFGLNLKELYTQNSLPFTKYDEALISMKQVHNLFLSINGSLFDSHFGQLVKSVANALTVTFPSKPNPNNLQAEINIISKISLIASKIITLCPTSLFDLLIKCRKYYTDSGKNESMRLIFHISVEDIQKSCISTAFSANYIKYLFSIQNPEQIFKDNAKYGFAAASTDRFVATHLKNLIDKDYFSELNDVVDVSNLEPIPTFLSFIDSKRKGVDWLNKCANSIDPDDWVLSRSDNPEVIFSKIVLDEKKKKRIVEVITKRIKSLTAEKPKAKPFVYDYISRSETFKMNPLKVTEAAVKVHETEPATLYNIVSFLYHSTLPLPETVTLKYIEELAMNNARSAKLLIGFFLYAYKKKYQINVEEWTKKLYIKTFNDSWYLVVALFLLNVKGSIPQLRNLYQNIVKKCLVSLGYSKMTHQTFIQAYQKETGVKWLLVRNAILVDIDYFRDFPLIVSELKTNKKLFMDFFESMTDMSNKAMLKLLLSTMSNLFTKPADSDLTLPCSYALPTNFPFPPRMLSFKEGTIQFKRSRYPDDLVNLIISGLEKQAFVPLNFFYVFGLMNLNDQQYQRIEQLFFVKKKDGNSKHLTSLRNLTAPGYYLLENHTEEEIIDFFSLKPPSFTRSYFRSLQYNFAKQINPTIAKSVVEHLTDVFPDLCYSGFAKYGMKMWKDANPLSKLFFGSLDNETGRSLIKELSIPSEETINIYNGLSTLSESQLARLILYTKTMLKEELGRIILDTAVSECSNFLFASNVIKDVINVLGHAATLAMVGNRDFLGKPKFELALIILHILENNMKKENEKDGLSFFEVLRSEKDNLFTDQMKIKVFSDLTNTESIDAIVHLKMSNKSNETEQPQ